jgi:DNA-binding response OmpR family regulator
MIRGGVEVRFGSHVDRQFAGVMRACLAKVCMLAGILTVAGTAWAAPAEPAAQPLDELQRAAVASLAFPPRTSPRALLDAAIRAADLEAHDVAADYLARLGAAVDAAGDRRADVLADLGDAVSSADLARLDRTLADRVPDVTAVVTEIRTASAARRRDSAWLARAAADLASPERGTRQAAAETLQRAGTAAVPALVAILTADATRAEDAEALPAARAAAGILAMLGPAAREPLLTWLGSDDVDRWPGVIRGLEAAAVTDISDFLFAPALVPDTPPAARAAARAALARRGIDPTTLTADAAIARLARRLDHTLSPAGLPRVDHLMLEPVAEPDDATRAFGDSVTGTVDRQVWNPETRSPEPARLSPRAARGRDAIHLARDLVALGAQESDVVHLVLLAQLEGLLVTSPDPDALPPAALRDPLTGPAGFDPETAADLLDEALVRDLCQAAAAVATAVMPVAASADAASSAAVSLTVRDALLRAVAVPDAALQFAAAATLARAGGPPPYRGSSRVVAALGHAATGTDTDLAVVAHPDRVVAAELAAGLARFGYRVETVRTGREAIFRARESADTTLVILGARINTPSAFETAQFLAQQGLGDQPTVLVVVDPLDDDGRGRYLQNLLLTFAELPCVGIVDRLDSFFRPVVDAETGAVLFPPRFPDALAQAAGPAAVDPATRTARAETRRARAAAAADLLEALHQGGWDVGPAVSGRYTQGVHAASR